MDIQEFNDAIANAELAMGNENLDQALKWYNKALEIQPNDVYSLSRAGAVYVVKNDFDKAFECFKKAIEVDPDNGDNIFNMGNGYFFKGDLSRAMEMYSEAEMKACSDDVKARIYYQLALCCSMKEDYKAALVNFDKYQDADTTGVAMTDPDVITEKIKIYIALSDIDNATKCALQWINAEPSKLDGYMVYTNLLLANDEFDKAEEALNNAEKYAEYDDNGKFNIDMNRASLYVAKSNTEKDPDGDCDQKAYDLVGQLIVSPFGTDKQKNELVIVLAELCLKMGKIDEAIDTANILLNKAEAVAETAAPSSAAMTAEEIEAQMEQDTAQMGIAMEEGRIDESMGDSAEINYDENGQPIRNYPDGVFGEGTAETVSGLDKESGSPAVIDKEQVEKARFVSLSAYALKEDYEKVMEVAKELKHSDNAYYAFFGNYSEAFSVKKLAENGSEKFTAERAQKMYDEVIAFFRKEMLNRNENSAYAVIFRARMYAESGKYTKAEEMAELMNDEDKAAVMEYIDQCRKEQNGGK